MTEPTTEDRKQLDRYDVLLYQDETYRTVPSGFGEQLISAHKSEARKRRWFASFAAGLLGFIIVVIGGIWTFGGTIIPAGIGAGIGIAVGVARYWQLDYSDQIPELAASDASTRAVREYVDDFDPEKTAELLN